MFSETVLDHFQRPRNAGELPGATAKVEVSNPVCGDILELAVIVEGERIQAVRFRCRGCTAAIAAASLLTEKIKGREVGGMEEVTAAALTRELGGLPEASAHAAQLAEDAVKALAKRP